MSTRGERAAETRRRNREADLQTLIRQAVVVIKRRQAVAEALTAVAGPSVDPETVEVPLDQLERLLAKPDAVRSDPDHNVGLG